ncbi:hypothetical protein [Halorubrum distributum]|uniref:hypothetical protein n=1 Tax=Halorubrum distributum TaxID=29283 RepID=UPI001268B674|nr:hypothetical protein [Halorubrum terrestre]
MLHKSERDIGRFIYERPAQWIPRQTLVDYFDIDESGVSRHVEHLYEDEFIQKKKEDGQSYVQWNGRGAGGFGYWLRQTIPSQMWSAGSELRPLLTIDRLGGAYLPTILFVILFFVGIVTALSAIVVSYFPSNSVLGFSAGNLVFLTGAITVTASLSLVLGIVGRVLEMALYRVWNYITGSVQSEG